MQMHTIWGMRLFVGSMVLLSHATWGMEIVEGRVREYIKTALDGYTREGYVLAPPVEWFVNVAVDRIKNESSPAVWMHHKNSAAGLEEGETFEGVVDTFGGIYSAKLHGDGPKNWQICVVKPPSDFSVKRLATDFSVKRLATDFLTAVDAKRYLTVQSFIDQKIDEVRYDDVCVGRNHIAVAKNGEIEIYDADIENGPVVKRMDSNPYNYVSDMLFVSENAKSYFFAIADHVLSKGTKHKVTDKKALVHCLLSNDQQDAQATFAPIFHDVHTFYDRLEEVKSKGDSPSYVSLVRYTDSGPKPCEVEKCYSFVGDSLAHENLVYKKKDGTIISLTAFRHLPELYAWTRHQPFYTVMSTELEGMGRGSQVYSGLFSENMGTIVHALCNTKSPKDIERTFQGMSPNMLAELFCTTQIRHWRANIRDTNISNWVDLQKYCIKWIDRREKPLATAMLKGHTVSLTPLGSLVIQPPKPWFWWRKTPEIFYHPVMQEEHKDKINSILKSPDKDRCGELINYFSALRHVNKNTKIYASGLLAAALYNKNEKYVLAGIIDKKIDAPSVSAFHTQTYYAAEEIENVSYDPGNFLTATLRHSKSQSNASFPDVSKWYQDLKNPSGKYYVLLNNRMMQASDTMPTRSFVTSDHKSGEYLRARGWGSWLGYIFYPRVKIIESLYETTEMRVFNISDMWGRIKDWGKIALGLR